jgi:BlaI family transcriptional regulator, penicillinase repressor
MKKLEKTAAISGAQREIMNIVWENGEVGVADVWRILSDRRPVARNTVLTLITRLADKGWLQMRRVGNAYRYTAARPRETVQVEEIHRLVNTVFEGSAEGLVMTLLEQGNLSPAESERIRAMILKADRKPGREKS